MRNRILLLVASLLLSCSTFADEQSGLTADQRVGEGLMLMLKGEKKPAWDILMVEAKKGNATAMFHLGNLMLQSPEYDDHLANAQKFFTAAAARGHKGAEALSKQVAAALAEKRSAPPMIAGLSGLPTAEQIADATRRLSEHTAQAVKFTGFVMDVPQVKITAFADNNAESISQLTSMMSTVKSRFAEAIGVDFYIIIDPQSWNASQTQIIRSSEMPQDGFMPDFGGRVASKFGVRRAPAIVIEPKDGPPRIISDPNSLLSEISRLL